MLFFAYLPLVMCSQKPDNLKDKFANYFLIGATINQEDYQIIDKDNKVLKIVSEDFNSVTPENSMKWMHSHPEYSKFTFSKVTASSKGLLIGLGISGEQIVASISRIDSKRSRGASNTFNLF